MLATSLRQVRKQLRRDLKNFDNAMLTWVTPIVEGEPWTNPESSLRSVEDFASSLKQLYLHEEARALLKAMRAIDDEVAVYQSYLDDPPGMEDGCLNYNKAKERCLMRIGDKVLSLSNNIQAILDAMTPRKPVSSRHKAGSKLRQLLELIESGKRVTTSMVRQKFGYSLSYFKSKAKELKDRGEGKGAKELELLNTITD